MFLYDPHHRPRPARPLLARRAAWLIWLVSCSWSPTDVRVPDVAIASGGVPIQARWSAFFGGTGADQFRDVATDIQGNSIMVGGSASANYPTTSGTVQPVHSSGAGSPGILNMDVIVTKVDPGGHMVWSTFLGGGGYDRAYAVEVDPQGYILVAGRAGAGFPTTPGSLQPNFAGGPGGAPYGPQDGFLCKLTSTGQRVWCTYFGGNEINIVRDIDVDPVGNVFLASSTQLDNWPAGWFANRFQHTRRGGTDDLLMKLSSDGSRVLWATYIGGLRDESRTTSVRATPNSIWYLTTSDGTDLPIVGGRPRNGGVDFWVGEFSLDGRQLLHSTYIGGPGTEGIETHNLAVEGDRVYIAAQSSSPSFPGTGSLSGYSGGHDGIVVALDTTAKLIAARYVGTSGPDGLEGVKADAAGVCIAGFMSGSLPGIPLWGAGGGKDAALLCLTRDVTQFIYGVTIGGSGDDYSRSLARTRYGLVGAAHSESANWPTLNGTAPYGGAGDAVALRMQP